MGSISGAIGQAIFGKPKLKTIYANDPLQERLTGSLVSGLDSLGKRRTKTVEDFESALGESEGVTRRLRDEDVLALGRSAGERGRYDPLEDYERLLRTKTGSLRSFVPDILGASNAELSRRRLGLGIHGSAPTTYDRVASLSSLGSSLAPILNTIYGTTGAEAAAAGLARSGALQDMVNVLAARRGLPDLMAHRRLLPAGVEADLFGRELEAAGLLGDITTRNIQGYRNESNPWADVFEAAGQFGEPLAAQAIGSRMGLPGYGGMAPWGAPGATPFAGAVSNYYGAQLPSNFGGMSPFQQDQYASMLARAKQMESSGLGPFE